MLTLIDILDLLLYVVTLLVLVQFVLSVLIAFNVVNQYNQFVSSLLTGLDRLLNPLYRPIRRILPSTGAIDFAPLALLVILAIIRIILDHLAANIISGAPL